MTDPPDQCAPLTRIIASWGIWPGLMMVFSQWESARLSGDSVPGRITFLTLAGTLAMYGSDRFLEKARLQAIASRHHLAGPRIFIVLVLALGLPTLAFLSRAEWFWLLILGATGLLYLTITTRIAPSPPLLKEALGSFCFMFLVWGLTPIDWRSSLAFWFLGLSNFLWCGAQDKDRDRINGLKSLAIRAPRVNRALARASGLAAAAWFLAMNPISPFGWCALLHGLWPRQRDWPVDLAFLPLVFAPILYLTR